MTSIQPPVCVGLDGLDLEEATRVVAELDGIITVFKVGLELFTSAGPAAVAMVRDAGADCFLDLKVHDVPATAAGAVARAAALGARLLTIHGLGGRDMVRAAVESAAEHGGPRLLTVTVLTSLDDHALGVLGMQTVAEQAKRIGMMAAEEGTDGLVLSARELPLLRPAVPDLLLATPGVRPLGEPSDDQRRVTTPGAAIVAGADLVILSRPILRAPDRRAAAQSVVDEVLRAAAGRERHSHDLDSSVAEIEDAELEDEKA
jgi:orotidine-5'-phosphate decarboxylase